MKYVFVADVNSRRESKEDRREKTTEQAQSISPLARAISLCETALRGHEEVQTGQRQTRQRRSGARRPKADEPKKAGGAPRPFPRHRLPGHQPIERGRLHPAGYQGPYLRCRPEIQVSSQLLCPLVTHSAQ